MEFECNLLRDLGYEIYLCKTTGGNRSCNINFEFDKTLTLQDSIITELNSYDFYSVKYPKKLVDIVNRYFDIIIIPNIYPLALNVAKNFKGKILLRAFGYENNINYEQLTRSTKAIKGWKKVFKPKDIIHYNEMTKALYKIKDRFVLGCAYKEIITNESPFFQKHSVYLPLGCGKSIWKYENTWIGTKQKIMFVCPSIETNYYGDIYKKFKINFGDMPHSIFGKNIYPNIDKSVLGFLDRALFNKALQEYKVMFYHSQEPRHLHYHPLEAIIFGQPLIFMGGGLLSMLSKNRCVGEAKDIFEAREKIKMVLNGDIGFINEIVNSQKIILEQFNYDFVRKQWESFINNWS